MLFNSVHFLFFLPVVIALYYLIPFRFRWILIFFASCYFYMALVPKYILILFAIILIDYVSALLIEKQQGQRRKLLLVLSICSNVILLAFFKYFNFLNENLTFLLDFVDQPNPVGNLSIILPIGLSFHTFQSMAYTIEVYRGNQKAERHLGYFANYVLFFPQMVAGPIERYDRLGNELKKEHHIRYENFSNGFRLMLFGFFAKMVIADNLAPIVNEVYSDPSKYNSLSIIIAVVFFSFQIYADFFGYSLIAMGAARLMGVHLMENFKSPYLSTSITEFWTRWHISLTSWFRDYLYIPLGGNRVKVPRWIFNILVVFAVSGLWHGPSWTFVIWGLLHGIIYLLEKAFSKQFNIPEEKKGSIYRIAGMLKTFVLVSLIWVFFRAESMEKVVQIFRGLVYNLNVTDELKIPYNVWILLLLFMSFDALFYRTRVDQLLEKKVFAVRWVVYAIWLFAITTLAGIENVPFIYFQF